MAYDDPEFCKEIEVKTKLDHPTAREFRQRVARAGKQRSTLLRELILKWMAENENNGTSAA